MFAAIISLLFVVVSSQLEYGSNFNGFQLPEVLDNRFRSASGYNYPIPSIPFDETTPVIPPIFDQPINITIPPFQDDLPQPTYLPPFEEPEPPIYDPVPPSNAYLPQQPHKMSKSLSDDTITILKMSCLNSKTVNFFRAQVQTKFSSLPPIIEETIGVSDACISSGGVNIYNLNFEQDSIVKCGVRRCANRDLCIKLRIPTVRGLKLPEDATVVLQCKPQDSVASQVRSLRFNPRIVQGRALSTVASGGSQRNFETEVSLYRRAPGSGEFTQVVSPGSSVQLGEDLLLRAAVRDGDGWAFTRMGAVVMQRTAVKSNPQGGTENFKTLVDEDGCRNQAMKAVCPEQPRRINPLVTTFPFRAFMFQGSIPGDEMILSVRMYGCLQYEDCPQATFCEENVKGNMIRSKRETENGTRRTPQDRTATADWKSYLEFRVVVPQDNGQVEGHNFDKAGGPLVMPFMVVCITTAALLLLVLTVVFVRRHLRHI